MKIQRTQTTPKQDCRREDRYPQTCLFPQTRLMQTLRAARTFRPVEQRPIDTVVTYGAYEKPI